MAKSDFAKGLDVIQSHLSAFLKPLGFQKKGRSHNRTTDGGLVHVVNLQMGEYPIGKNYVIPGIRESFYGKFAVNLGVFLPCVYEAEWQKPVGKFVQEYHCTIRNRLSELAFGTDQWFELNVDYAVSATTLVQLFDRFGLPFLDQFSDYASALAYFDAHGNLPFQNSERAALEAGIIAHHLGAMDKSQRLFEKAQATDHKGFRQHVTILAKRLGYHLPNHSQEPTPGAVH